MRRLVTKLKPASGFARIFHLFLNLVFPFLVFILVRIDFAQLAVMLLLISKWRMFAVKPRHWAANIRANSVDIIAGISFIAFMHYSHSIIFQLLWTVLYAVWLIWIKPRSSVLFVAIQGMIAQLFGLMALYLAFVSAPLYVLVIASWLIAYLCSRHFLVVFDEPATRAMSHIWAFFAVALTWLLGHWLLFYGQIPQIVLLLSVISYGLGALYYLHKTDRLSAGVQRQIILMMCAILVVIIIFSDWTDKTI